MMQIIVICFTKKMTKRVMSKYPENAINQIIELIPNKYLIEELVKQIIIVLSDYEYEIKSIVMYRGKLKSIKIIGPRPLSLRIISENRRLRQLLRITRSLKVSNSLYNNEIIFANEL